MIKGLGIYKKVLVANLILYYGIALPLAVFLAFKLNFESYGIWYSILTTYIILVTYFYLMIYKFTDWD